jgi:formate hydrogenlyase subunit 3/multisubunit Na+/H+ antiporter MnhD subunit
LPPVLEVLAGGSPLSWRNAWEVPYGTAYLELDALSAFFVLVILAVSALAAIYGAGYLGGHHPAIKPLVGSQDLREDRTRSLGPPWFFFNALSASMALVALARNGVLFLVAWELMALASFFLVVFEDEEEGVTRAGWTYLVATHLGTSFLLVFFAILGREAGSLDFDRVQTVALSPTLTNTLFLLGLVGFGTKAGLMPFHVWLPEAHPAAPSHVSAVMSGAMIKMGIYGILRMLGLLGPLDAPVTWALVTCALLSAVLGAVFALAQRDLKRLLAYSSIENVGIVCLGIGVGLLGREAGSASVTVLGFAGALLHVWNHAVMKSLLFLSAGSLVRAAGTRSLDRLGGLLKRLPSTGAAFLVGAIAICGLPPLNGFASELLVLLGSLYGGTTLPATSSLAMIVVAAALALTAGLAAVAFTKAAGIALLGEPRSSAASAARETGAAMRWSVLALSGGCVALGGAASWVVTSLAPVLQEVSVLPGSTLEEGLALASHSLGAAVVASALLAILVALFVALRASILAKREVSTAVTWDCGYARPTPRMQYTASSFTEPHARLFHVVLRTRQSGAPPSGLFPLAASLKTDTGDVFSAALFAPAFRWLGVALSKLRWIQHGRLNLYMLYIALALLALLVSKLG